MRVGSAALRGLSSLNRGLSSLNGKTPTGGRFAVVAGIAKVATVVLLRSNASQMCIPIGRGDACYENETNERLASIQSVRSCTHLRNLLYSGKAIEGRKLFRQKAKLFCTTRVPTRRAESVASSLVASPRSRGLAADLLVSLQA